MSRRSKASCTLLLALFATLVPLGRPAHAATIDEGLSWQVHAELNAERAARGVAPLQWDGPVATASTSWAASLSTAGRLSHSTHGRAEIIAQGSRTGQLTEMWMRSNVHRNILLDPNMIAVGVGVRCDGSGQMWIVAQFHQAEPGRRVPSSAATPRVATPGSGLSCSARDAAQRSIQRLYVAYFNRGADPSGLAFWTDRFDSGWSVETISGHFASSREFRLRYGTPNDDQFVNLAYHNVLGRAPDPQGRAHWLGMARRSGRGAVMLGFADSLELRQRLGLF